MSKPLPSIATPSNLSKEKIQYFLLSERQNLIQEALPFVSLQRLMPGLDSIKSLITSKYSFPLSAEVPRREQRIQELQTLTQRITTQTSNIQEDHLISIGCLLKEILAPIFSLPDELLLRIMSSVCEGDVSQLVTPLMAVCKHWFVLITNSLQLWTTIYIPQQSPSSFWLLRGAMRLSSPLKVVVQLSSTAVRRASAMQLVMNRMRITSLSIYFHHDLLEDYIDSPEFPELLHLEIHMLGAPLFTSWRTMTPLAYFFRHISCPQLLKLALHGSCPTRILKSSIPRTVVDITIKGSCEGVIGCNHEEKLLELLRQPNLSRLQLSLGYYVGSLAHVSGSPALTNLLSLQYYDVGPSFDWLIAGPQFATPSLKQMSIYCGKGSLQLSHFAALTILLGTSVSPTFDLRIFDWPEHIPLGIQVVQLPHNITDLCFKPLDHKNLSKLLDTLSKTNPILLPLLMSLEMIRESVDSMDEEKKYLDKPILRLLAQRWGPLGQEEIKSGCKLCSLTILSSDGSQPVVSPKRSSQYEKFRQEGMRLNLQV